MAERRMFAKTIIDSDAFIDMPISARLLYYDLAMRADDDGFVNAPKKIMKFVGASIDDMNVLIAKKFILVFESGVIVIKHWRIHNYIQKDRYQETKYKDEKKMLKLDENNSYTLGNGKELDDSGETKMLEDARLKRAEEYKNSELPYSFTYKMRYAFDGMECPICHKIMNCNNNFCKPTIQHNIPISKGGKHEIDNISIICNRCNYSIQNRENTDKLNNDLVKEVWECIRNGYTGKYSIGKNSIDEYSIAKEILKEKEIKEGEDEKIELFDYDWIGDTSES